jgi:leucine dehydrogenase
VAAEDVGTSVADMQAAARETRYIAGLPSRLELAGGAPSPWSNGVFPSDA